MIKRYSQGEIERLRKSGLVLKEVKEKLKKLVKIGANQLTIEKQAQELINSLDSEPAFLNQPGPVPYPAATCISVNDQVVHHIPEDKILKRDDLVSIDLGVKKEGMYTDTAFTIYLGKRLELKTLVKTTKRALKEAAEAARPGNQLGDIGAVIEKTIERASFSVVRELSGHGIGEQLHDEPAVPNYGQPGQGLALESGMVLAIEPIASLGSGKIKGSFGFGDNWTVVTEDKEPAAHFEETFLITNTGSEVLTA